MILAIFMVISTALLIMFSTASLPFHLANAQPNTATKPPLPVILVHGYFEGPSVWNEWQELLQNKSIKSFPVTFQQSEDECGSANDHANELGEKINEVKMKTGEDKVNIVGHSKGGLDARVFLADNITRDDVANLIMIGTPNAGSPLADLVTHSSLPILAQFGNPFAEYWLCAPAINDLQTTASIIDADQNPNTNYYTIAGNWSPFFSCSASLIDTPGSNYLNFVLGMDNDGIVPVESVESQPYFLNLPHSFHCHQDLLGDEEFKIAEPILLGK
jgi:pimeloyl-ACP methyl ester carboxylesterase